jgi:hypothetical protein
VFRISDTILDTVIYLYPSVDDAVAGRDVGASGFLVGVPSTVSEERVYLYAVTNRHAVRKSIREGNAPVIRLNTKDGGKDVLPTTEDDWAFHQDEDDVVCLLKFASPEKYKFNFIPVRIFLTAEEAEVHHIGPGDEVIMAGRFITHEGRQRNTPTARFGNISMLPWEPIPQSNSGIAQESFLVETRSLGGFSGSPVFVRIPSGMKRVYREGVRHTGEGGFWLLGVDWGHLPVYEKVKEKNRRDDIPEGWVVESNSGQMAVVPAWRLRDLLDQEELAVVRMKSDELLRKQQESSPVVLDMRTEAAQEHDEESSQRSEPFSQDDFFRDLKTVARKQNQPSQRD